MKSWTRALTAREARLQERERDLNGTENQLQNQNNELLRLRAVISEQQRARDARAAEVSGNSNTTDLERQSEEQRIKIQVLTDPLEKSRPLIEAEHQKAKAEHERLDAEIQILDSIRHQVDLAIDRELKYVKQMKVNLEHYNAEIEKLSDKFVQEKKALLDGSFTLLQQSINAVIKEQIECEEKRRSEQLSALTKLFPQVPLEKKEEFRKMLRTFQEQSGSPLPKSLQ